MGIDGPNRAAAAMRSRDQCSEALGIEVLEAQPGTAAVEMVVRADMCNGHRICHGGLIFTLADTAMAFASNSYDETAVATSASVEFVEPAREGDRLRATAVERHKRSRRAIYDVSVERGDGVVVALFRGQTLTIGGSVSEPT